MEFREQIEEALSARDWMLKDLAETMGVSLGYVSRVWNDPEEKISLSVIEAICEALGLKPVEIDLYVEKMLPFLAREHDSLRDTGRKLLKLGPPLCVPRRRRFRRAR